MQESEITVRVLEEFETIKEKLEEKGFKVIREVNLNDYYYTSGELKDDYKEMIKKSILIRENSGTNYNVEMIYKNKTFDENGRVIFEEKIKTHLESFIEGRRIFEAAGFTCWCHLKNDSLIYSKDDIEFALQNVEGLGIFIEYEENDSLKNLPVKEKIDVMINRVKDFGLDLDDDFFVKKVELRYLNK